MWLTLYYRGLYWKILVLWLDKHQKIFKSYPFKRQSHRMVKHTQTIRRQFADELFKCLTILWGWRLKGYVLTYL